MTDPVTVGEMREIEQEHQDFRLQNDREKMMGEAADTIEALRAEVEYHRKQAAYWHARYAEICKNRGRLDALNKAPIFGSGAKEAGE